MFYRLLAFIAFAGATFGSLLAWQIISLDKWVDPGEMEDWHIKFGKFVKIGGPIVALLSLFFIFK